MAISTLASKRELCLSLGADFYIDESTQNSAAELQKLGGANVIVSTAPSSAAVLRMMFELTFGSKLLAISLPLDVALFTPCTSVSCRRYDSPDICS